MLITARSMPVQGLETLAVHRAAVVDLASVPQILAAASDWLGPEVEAPVGYRRYLSDLAFPLLARPRTILFRKAALVDIGPPMRMPDGSVAAEIAWRSATLAPLFPVFAGRLIIRADRLELEGAYAPPFGEVGRLVDRTRPPPGRAPDGSLVPRRAGVAAHDRPDGRSARPTKRRGLGLRAVR